MKMLYDRSVIGIGLTLLSPATLAIPLEDVQTFVGAAGFYAFLLFTFVVAVLVCFMQRQDKRAAPLYSPLNQDKRAAPLHRLLDGDATYSVESDALVVECVRKMTDRKIGALVVMNGKKLIGIFTERDALNKVLAAGRDPRSTRVFEVMTKDPYCVSPEMTVRAAMELVTKRHFRHLPVVDNGTVHAVLSSRDLMYWLARDRMGEVHDLLELAA
ncbi:MAG: CBS domain-containing protein [Burkholderiales bacterium]|nr:CBS domain-containing protein [Burkholderiales bacterium]